MVPTVIESGDFGDTIATAQALSVSDVAGGYLGVDDADMFAITLTAGMSYSFDVDANGSPGLMDGMIEIFDASGNLVSSNDDSGLTGEPYNPYLEFIAGETGTYYVKVTKSTYSEITGHPQVGEYTFGVSEAAPPSILDSIDWAYNAPSTINVFLNDVDLQVDDGYADLRPFTANAIQNYEYNSVLAMLEEYESVIDVEFNLVTDIDAADFAFFFTDDGFNAGSSTLGYFGIGGGTLGVDEASVDLEGWMTVNTSHPIYGADSFQTGGYYYYVLLHELGHGMGMAHPHDTGGGSTVMTGVSSSSSTGAFDLNQGVNTVMSYTPTWGLNPAGGPTTNDWGYAGGLMALDIAYLQSQYGANTQAGSGNSKLFLVDENGPGTYYESIWDVSGIDEIIVRADVTADATINLNAATIDYSETGGGPISYVEGVLGGFTIAQGVVIERAKGGLGDDLLIGNAANNLLRGWDGQDSIEGGDGADILNGQDGADLLEGEDGMDKLIGGGEQDTLVGGEASDRLLGGADADTFWFDSTIGKDVILDFEDGFDQIALEMDALNLGSFDDVVINILSGRTVVKDAANTWKFIVKGDYTLVDESDFLLSFADLY